MKQRERLPRVTAPSAAYIVDTNLYIRAFREAEFGERFRAWHGEVIARLAMSAVVLHELLVGVDNEHKRQLLERTYAAEFRQRGRLLVPSEAAWSRAASADRQLRAKGGYVEKLAQRSFANDLLIAFTCREIGAILVTANTTDFELIQSVTGVRYAPDLPAGS
jgi:predicted nucleic acid-binding protein